MKIKRTLLCIAISLMAIPLYGQNIYRTACQGNITRLDSLLNHATINTQDFRGRSLLHWAVACQDKEVFDFLVDRGIETELLDNDDATPLHIAVQFNRTAFFEYIADLDDYKDWAERYGGSLMERAIVRNNITFVQKLIKDGVNIHAKNERGSTPLEIALRTRASEISNWLIEAGADPNQVRNIQLSGEYMGQQEPGLKAKPFAPNFVSTEESEFGSVFSQDKTEFFYGVDVNGRNQIRYSRLVENNWTKPEIILSHDLYGYNDPFLSPDEQRLYFITRRSLDGLERKNDHDIWYVEKTENGWSEPINAGTNINSDGNEYYISFTSDGTMYFSSNINASEDDEDNLDIYYSKFVDGEFQKAVRLPESVNTPNYEADVFVAPDESYIIFCSTRPDGLGRGDLYISFKNADGTWSEAVNMGDRINTKHHELCPFVTADGKYLFFTSDQDIYWVNASIIEEYR